MNRLPLFLGLIVAIGCREPAPISTLVGPFAATGKSQSADPTLTADPDNGDALITWVAGDSGGFHLYFARSSDQGQTWSAPVQVTSKDHDIHPHGEASPRVVAAPGGVIAVAWPLSFDAPGREYGATHMRFTRSTDGGRTWAAVININDDTTRAPTGHTFHGAAWEGERSLVVAWLNERRTRNDKAHQEKHPVGADGKGVPEESDATIHVARSRDFGATWDRQNEIKWNDVCPCCRIAMARNPDGTIVNAWRKHFPGSVRDIVAGLLSGDAASQVRVHADEWVFPGCPHTGPSIAVDDEGDTHLAWFTGKPGATGIRYARRAAGKAAFDSAAFLTHGVISTAHVAVAGIPGGGSVIAYDRDGAGEARLVVSVVDHHGARGVPMVLSGSQGVDHPTVVAVNDDVALVAWTAQSDHGSRAELAAVKVARKH